MFWKKKIKDPQKDKPTILEQAIMDHLILVLRNNYKERLRGQIDHLKLIKRIQYSKDIATEFYPEKFGSIPENVLFDRKDDFCLGKIKFKIKNQNYVAEVYFVLGALFEIRIKPIPINLGDLRVEEIEFFSDNLNKDFVD